MSKVSNFLESTNDESKCLVVYDKYSVDSIFGAAIIKYIIENITDAADNAICADLFDKDVDFFDDEYTNITFVGCYPNLNDISKLFLKWNDKMLFILSNKADLAKVKNEEKKVFVEYSEKDSCSLNLYKIAFGEFESKVPEVITIISDGTMNKYSDTYEDYLKLSYGIKYKTFQDIYSIVYELCTEDGASVESSIESIKTVGASALDEMVNIIDSNKSMILKNTFIVDNNIEVPVIWSNGLITETITREFEDFNLVINIFRNDYSINLEMIKVGHAEYETRLEELETELTDIQTSLDENPNDVAMNLAKTNKIKEKKHLEYLINFDCGKYLKNNYKGSGSANHGFANVSYKVFIKLLEMKTI